ncbi:MAG: NAD-dependent succinate-semialdehyde dehydrogenase [Verrucomicrobiales bacterium]
MDSEANTYKPINPATGRELDPVELWDADHAADMVDLAASRFLLWREISFGERAERMTAAADLLEERKEALARGVTEEMGKPIVEARAEVEKCAWVCRYYAENAESFLETEAIAAKSDDRTFVSYRPLGPILAVMPWNFPLWQVFRFAAPNLMAGNVALLKHARNVQGSANAIERLFSDAGFPGGCFVNLPIGHEVASTVVADPRVRAVTMTGSVGGGRQLGAEAGKHLKKTVLELGGSDAYVILEDADVDHAAEVCAKSRLLNTGQSCIAAKRFIAVDVVHDEFVEKLTHYLNEAAVGDPLREETDVGPLARRDLRDDLASQVERSIEQGAVCRLGGKVPEDPGLAEGFYYLPTVLAAVCPGMPAFDEELFGPVAAVVVASDEAEAVRLANESNFGLGGAVFTRDLERGERIAADEMDCGLVTVNGLVASDPRVPFGGVKDSGYGRELGIFGIREFVNIKAVVSSGAAGDS